MKTGLLFLFFIAFAISSFSQSLSEFKELALNKEWKLELYEEGGEKFPPAPESKNDKMIFKSDYSVKSIEHDKTDNGKWSYSETSKELTVVDSKTGMVMKMKVVKLTTSIFVVEFKDPEGSSLIIHMKS